MLKINLLIGDKEKTFMAPFVSARKLRNTLKLTKKLKDIGEEMSEEDLDSIIEYLVDLYGNQFTVDDLYDGYPSNEIFEKAMQDMEKVVGSFEDKIKN